MGVKSYEGLFLSQGPFTRTLQVPHIPVTAFSQTDLFF